MASGHRMWWIISLIVILVIVSIIIGIRKGILNKLVESNRGVIINIESDKGESDKVFTQLTRDEPSYIKNSLTGKNEKIIFLELAEDENLNLREYLFSYYNLYMEDDYDFDIPDDKQDLRVHSIIDLSMEIVTVVTDFGDRLQVYEYKYIENKEGYDKVLGRGAELGEYFIFKDDGMIINRSHFN